MESNQSIPDTTENTTENTAENTTENNINETSNQLMERLLDLRNENIIMQSSNPFIRMINRSIELIPQQFVINNIDNIIDESFNQDEIIKKPTNKEFIKNIEIKTVKEETPEMICSICMDTIKLNDKYISLPCDNDHFFHIESCEKCDGILPWLNENNTCPICRYELPIEEPIEEPGEPIEEPGEPIEEPIEESIEEMESEEIPITLNRTQSDMIMSLIESHFNPVIIREEPITEDGFSNMEIEEAIRRSLD